MKVCLVKYSGIVDSSKFSPSTVYGMHERASTKINVYHTYINHNLTVNIYIYIMPEGMKASIQKRQSRLC